MLNKSGEISMNSINVLLADDKEKYLISTAGLLGRMGYKVVMARNGTEALTVLSQKKTDVVVLNVMMPGMDGLEVLKIMKNRDPLIEVVLLTGHATIDSIAEGLKAGAYDFVVKPVDISELASKIEAAFIKHEQARQEITQILSKNNMNSHSGVSGKSSNEEEKG
jgi:DNA-binding NtrC family response regulator